MKKVLSIVLMAIAVVFFTITAPGVAAADAIADGAKVFSSTCAACHMGGKNVINPAKTLQARDLEKYGMNSAEAIMTQVINGKGAMPSFKQLKPEQIQAVAAYVLDTSAKGW